MKTALFHRAHYLNILQTHDLNLSFDWMTEIRTTSSTIQLCMRTVGQDVNDCNAEFQVFLHYIHKSREGDHLKDPGVDGRIILKWTCERLGVGAQTGLIWLRIGMGGGLLCIR